MDEVSQKIVLRWSPSPDTLAAGYHICTGDTCRQYAVLGSRWDTTYTCDDHSSTMEHRYRLHVFDTSGNTSILTPPIGNMVLHVEAEVCKTVVSVEWTPCVGMYSGVAEYRLYARFSPISQDYILQHTTDSTGFLKYDIELSEGVEEVAVKVCAVGHDTLMQALSNVVVVERGRLDTARAVEIDSVKVDSSTYHVELRLNESGQAETNIALWRSVNGGQWGQIATLSTGQTFYLDNEIHPYQDSLLCYRTTLLDECNNDYAYSEVKCISLPSPADPNVVVANALLLGDESNCFFLPHIDGVIGGDYQLHIYNRQGLCVFSTTNPMEAWYPPNRTARGVYVYMLRVQFADGTTKVVHGAITLIK